MGVIPTGKMGHDLHYRPLKMVSMNGFGWFSTDGSVRGVGWQNGGRRGRRVGFAVDATPGDALKNAPKCFLACPSHPPAFTL